MRSHRGEFSIGTMCWVFGVGRSAYYAFCSRPQSKRSTQDRELGEVITQIHAEKKQRYGAIRIDRELRKRGERHSRKRIARLMHQQGLKPKRMRRYVTTTNSKHAHPVADNLLKRDFTATAPNQKWVGDITYIPTEEGWLYLAVILDLFSRRVIGWAMSQNIDQQLTRQAMVMALVKRQPTQGLIMHSDRGVQYAAGDYQRLLSDWSITPSMSRKGNCYDNAVSESFFATLKGELVDHECYATRQEARTSIFEYIESFYNRERLHSTLDYMTPVEFEQAYAEQSTGTNKPTTVVNLSEGKRFSMVGGGEHGCTTTQ